MEFIVLLEKKSKVIFGVFYVFLVVFGFEFMGRFGGGEDGVRRIFGFSY